MRIEFHTIANKDIAERLCWIERALGIILINQDNIMSSLDDLKAAQAVTDTKIASVKADVEKLMAALAAVPPAGLTPDQQAKLDESVTHAGAINDALSGVDAEANPPAA